MVLIFLFTLGIHEYCHALAGYLLGDRTAERAGRLTLNPLAHVDPLGFLALLTVGFGWGKPVPFNPYNLKYPRWGPVFVAGAGPASNLVIGILCASLFYWIAPNLGQTNLLVFVLQYAAILNFILCLFNLIPIPPLDGSKALLALLADERYHQIRHFVELRGPTLLLVLILTDISFNVGIFNGLYTIAEGLFHVIAF